MEIEMTCLTCGSHDLSKNSTTRRGQQNYKCRDCNRQFVEVPQWKLKDKDTRSFVGRLLLEKIPLAAIARATQVSDSWLQGYANACYGAVPKAAEVIPKAKGKLSVQMTDFWEVYVTAIPCKRHEAVGQNSDLTSYIERLNDTLRRRISRLVRKFLSFSKKLENRIGYDLDVHL
jgi:predicted Fe-S protein YdhL (DUF1289 family)